MFRIALLAALPALSSLEAQLFVPPSPVAKRAGQDKKAPEKLQTVVMTARVMDTDGQPIQGAGIALFSRKETKNSHQCLTNPAAVSDADGRIEFTIRRAATDRRAWLLAAKKHASRLLRVLPTKHVEKGVEVFRAELGDIVMHEGFSILGLIRDQDGNPVAGAEVTAAGILNQIFVNHNARAPHSTSSYGISDAKGRVRLTGIPRHGASVQVTSKDHYGWSADYINRHTPLVATLETGGQVDGVVLDAAGKTVKGARVGVYSESATRSVTGLTDDDGRFKLSLPGSGRYRLSYYGKVGGSTNYTYEYSKIFRGPQVGLRLQFGQGAMDNRGNPLEKAADDAAAAKVAKKLAGRAKAKAGTENKNKVKVRILDARTGVALREARATVVWWPPANWQHNAGYLERQLQRKKDEKLDERGNLLLAGPVQGQPNTGRILVAAKGFAPQIIKEVEWNEEGKNEVEVKMLGESAVAGIIIDPKSGKPLQGVRVMAVTDPSLVRVYQPQPVRRKLEGTESAVTTNEKGEFRIGELPGGELQIYVAHPKRADIPPVSVSVDAAAEAKGIRIEYPEGGSLIGTITGAAVKPGWRVRIRRLPEPQSNFGMTYGLSEDQQYESVAVDDEGRFSIHGLTRANYLLSMTMPYPHGIVEVPMEPVRMRRDALKRTFDITDDLPGRLSGRVKIDGGGFPPGRLILIARSAKSYNRYSGYYGRLNLQGKHTLLGARGAFDLPLAEGQYYVQVLDLMTKLTLFQGTRPITVRATKTTQKDVDVSVAPVTLELKPEQEGAPIAISTIEIRAEHPQPPSARNINVFGQNDAFTGVGLRIKPGETRVQLMLPVVPCKLLARSDAHNLDPKMGQHNFPAQGQVELTPESGKSNKVAIEVSAPQISGLEEEEKGAKGGEVRGRR